MEEIMKIKTPFLCVALVGGKGGVGKSTISSALAQTLKDIMEYENVCILNFDIKQDYRKAFIPESISFATIDSSFGDGKLYLNEVMEENKIDVSILDTGGYDDPRVLENMDYINTLIFPTKTDSGSYLMLKEMFENEYKEHIRNTHNIILINQTDESIKQESFTYVKKQIIEQVINPLGLSEDVFDFVCLKKSRIPTSLNSSVPSDRLTIQKILLKPNVQVYQPFLETFLEIAELIIKNK